MPRPFRFQLQPVLDQRARVEEQRMVEVAKLERERIEIESRLRSLQQSIAGSKHDLRARLAPVGGDAGSAQAVPVSIADVRLQANASLHLTFLAQRAALELAGAYKRLEAARARLLEAATARKAVDLLKERRREEWKREQSRREFQQLDEILSTPRAPALGAMDDHA